MLTSRPLLKKENLSILIDTEAFNRLLSKEDATARTLLNGPTRDFVRFLRTPAYTDHEELAGIPAYHLKYDAEGNPLAIVIATEDARSSTAFGYRLHDIETVGKRLLKKGILTSEERKQLILAFVQARLNDSRRSDILVTDKKVLLGNRLWLESKFPGRPLGVCIAKEAKEIEDLFHKHRGVYRIPGQAFCNRGYYYLLSFRAMVPSFHFGDSNLDALARRFIFLLTSADEIGFQYYSSVDNDSMDITEYHFNYFISLVTGILDSLAISTDSQYRLGFHQRPQKISLDPNAGKDFLRAIRDEPLSGLRAHIQSNAYFVKLMFELRHPVVHRRMLDKSKVSSRGHNEKWETNCFWVDPNIEQRIRQCRDKVREDDPFSEWGLYQMGTLCLLEPYHFVRTATRILAAFCSEYLELLGFDNFIATSQKSASSEDFIRHLQVFGQSI